MQNGIVTLAGVRIVGSRREASGIGGDPVPSQGRRRDVTVPFIFRRRIPLVRFGTDLQRQVVVGHAHILPVILRIEIREPPILRPWGDHPIVVRDAGKLLLVRMAQGVEQLHHRDHLGFGHQFIIERLEGVVPSVGLDGPDDPADGFDREIPVRPEAEFGGVHDKIRLVHQGE